MKKLSILVAAVCLLLALTGCGFSQTTEAGDLSGENGAASVPLPSVAVLPKAESAAEPNHAAAGETDQAGSTDAPTITDQSGTIPEETEPLAYDVQIGDSLCAVKEALNSRIDTEFCDAVIWKDSTGYHVACAGEDEDTIYAVVRFSDDLELLEAEGLEPIEPITQLEEWLGKTEAEFVERYGPYHYHRQNTNIYGPSYISKDGTVYRVELEHGTIVRMNCFTIKHYHYASCTLTTSEETELPEYEVHIGDPIRKISESLGDSITVEFNAFVTWKDSKGNHIACTGDDWKNIYAIVSFSDDLELLDAEGLEPIEPIPRMEKWLGKTEKEFIAQYGPYHFQPGSGNYMPSYISKNGTVYYLGTDRGTIVSIHCFAIDGRFNSVYYTYP